MGPHGAVTSVRCPVSRPGVRTGALTAARPARRLGPAEPLAVRAIGRHRAPGGADRLRRDAGRLRPGPGHPDRPAAAGAVDRRRHRGRQGGPAAARDGPGAARLDAVHRAAAGLRLHPGRGRHVRRAGARARPGPRRRGDVRAAAARAGAHGLVAGAALRPVHGAVVGGRRRDRLLHPLHRAVGAGRGALRARPGGLARLRRTHRRALGGRAGHLRALSRRRRRGWPPTRG